MTKVHYIKLKTNRTMGAIKALLVILITGLAMLGIVKICKLYNNHSSQAKKTEK